MHHIRASPSFLVLIFTMVVMVSPMRICRSKPSNVYGFVPVGFRLFSL